MVNLITKLCDGSYNYIYDKNELKYSRNVDDEFLLTYYIHDSKDNRENEINNSINTLSKNKNTIK